MKEWLRYIMFAIMIYVFNGVLHEIGHAIPSILFNTDPNWSPSITIHLFYNGYLYVLTSASVNTIGIPDILVRLGGFVMSLLFLRFLLIFKYCESNYLRIAKVVIWISTAYYFNVGLLLQYGDTFDLIERIHPASFILIFLIFNIYFISQQPITTEQSSVAA